MITDRRTSGMTALLIVALLAALGQPAGRVRAASPGPIPPVDPATRVVDLSTLEDMEHLIGRLAGRRVVFVGETHDRYDHHLNQLRIIQGLYRQDRRLAIGLEPFQQPFQSYLDSYVAGEIDERALLDKTEYFTRWRFDYRLYRPILRFARDQGIPLVALNVPTELTKKVAKGGLQGLSRQERARVPADMERDDADYRARIEQVFRSHPAMTDTDFEYFFEAQLLWDEGMAECAAHYLQAHPDTRMVVLTGSGHLAYRQGIPRRLLRRAPVSAAVVINAAGDEPDPALGDFLLFHRRLDLPPSGRLGVMLDPERGSVRIQGFADDSPARQAGLKAGDRILAIAGAPVDSYADIRYTLMDRRVGEQVQVEVLRKDLIMDDVRLSYPVTLE